MSNLEYYLSKAAEMRELAANVHDPLMRHRFVLLADKYELLAQTASSVATLPVPPQGRRATL